ncbi:MAG: aconitate hydratase AcnA [Micrococcales bacterium]|nr:aconitate hydratase AcnA [Micrococcales bacterium]
MTSIDSFGTSSKLTVGGQSYLYYRLSAVPGLDQLPISLKYLAESLLRHEDGSTVTADHIQALANWDPTAQPATEIPFHPGRVLMQDFTGVPCLVDLAVMRETMLELGGNTLRINPQIPAEMVIDHSLIIDVAGQPDAMQRNMELEYQRNSERYQFLRWGQVKFDRFKVVPPGTGIVHQVNVEHLARGVMKGLHLAYPDTCVGTDSHTTMAGGLGVLAWGVGGIEAEAAMLGQPVSMLIPQVVGFKLSGTMPPLSTATDLVLTITQMLRTHGVVGKFVEFYGQGAAALPLADRTTIANMAPEYGATCGFFPVDDVTLDYYRLTGRSEDQVALIEAYCKAQGMWLESTPTHGEEPVFSEYLELDLSTVVPSIAGPKRPQDRIELSHAKQQFLQDLQAYLPDQATASAAKTQTSNSQVDGPTPTDLPPGVEVTLAGQPAFELNHGDVCIASITSCTNTSNPSVMLAAGLLAQKAVAKGLTAKPWVKTSMAPGSQAVTSYLEAAGLTQALDALGFNLVGYGCATCIGNSGPLAPELSAAIAQNQLAVTAVLSGNRNFEGRISPDVAMNYLASPPLVVAYALAGTVNFDFSQEPLGIDAKNQPVFLQDIWPSPEEVQNAISQFVTQPMYKTAYASVFMGDDRWYNLEASQTHLYHWDPRSTYVRKPPYFDAISQTPAPIGNIGRARVLALLGDSVTTDHISPAGHIPANSPAGVYLAEQGVEPADFNSYGSRRGNHEVMVRGTFANQRLRNQLVDQTGGFTRDFTQGGIVTSMFDAAQSYSAKKIPLVILAGKEYGTGSSRDWAAKGTALLGVKAVLAQSFERIHRSNLIGMGVLPLQFLAGQDAATLGLDGSEVFSITGLKALNDGVVPKTVPVTATKQGGEKIRFRCAVRIDTPGEAEYYKHGGILHYVLRKMAKYRTVP